MRTPLVLSCLLLLGASAPGAAPAPAPDWLDRYTAGVRLAERGDHEQAALEFLRAVRIKDRDNDRERLTGMRTVEYFPHRELGVSLAALGITDFARKELQTSLEHVYTERAGQALARLR